MRKSQRNTFWLSLLAMVLVLYTNCSPFAASDLASGGSNGTSSVGGPGMGTVPGRIPVVGDYKSIPSEFDVNQYLVPAWGTGYTHKDNENVPDTVGAFRFICGPSHEAYDDPVVFPGQPGKSHLHQFWGNSQANGNSTYESLRSTA